MKQLMLALMVAVVVSGCGGKKEYVKKGELQRTLEQESVQKKYLEAIGIGAADSTLTNSTQRRATSRNAAIVAAQYEMLSMVKGIDLEGGIRVEKAIERRSDKRDNFKSSGNLPVTLYV